MATSAEESDVGDDLTHLKNKASQSIENSDVVTDTERAETNTGTVQDTPVIPRETSIVRSCIPGCRYRSKGGGDQVRCCLCGIDVKPPHVSQHSSPLTVDILPLYAQYSFPGRTQTHLTTSSLDAPLTDGSATLCRIPSHRSSAHYHQSDTRLPKHTPGYQLLRCIRPPSPRSRARRQSLPLKTPGF